MTPRELSCRIQQSGHSRVVVFHTARGDEIFLLPAERLDPAVVRKLEAEEVRCAVEEMRPDGNADVTLRTTEGELLFRSNVWIRSAARELLR